MVVTVYARHSGKCPQSKVKNAGQYRRCKCPFWQRWDKCNKRSARMRSWEIANKAARKLEEKLVREALGIETPKPPDHVTIDSALELYILDRVQRGKGFLQTPAASWPTSELRVRAHQLVRVHIGSCTTSKDFSSCSNDGLGWPALMPQPCHGTCCVRTTTVPKYIAPRRRRRSSSPCRRP